MQCQIRWAGSSNSANGAVARTCGAARPDQADRCRISTGNSAAIVAAEAADRDLASLIAQPQVALQGLAVQPDEEVQRCFMRP
jgi:hypothetical protein